MHKKTVCNIFHDNAIFFVQISLAIYKNVVSFKCFAPDHPWPGVLTPAPLGGGYAPKPHCIAWAMGLFGPPTFESWLRRWQLFAATDHPLSKGKISVESPQRSVHLLLLPQTGRLYTAVYLTADREWLLWWPAVTFRLSLPVFELITKIWFGRLKASIDRRKWVRPIPKPTRLPISGLLTKLLHFLKMN